jgi:hypothetical protein
MKARQFLFLWLCSATFALAACQVFVEEAGETETISIDGPERLEQGPILRSSDFGRKDYGHIFTLNPGTFFSSKSSRQMSI